MTSQSKKAQVLIVDDIPENLTVLEKILNELDVDVTRAASGNEALRATLYTNFSLILLDVLMPGMSGLEVADVLKQEDSTADIPIIFITAMDKDEDCELKAYSKGAVDLLYKPFNKSVLLSKVKILLDLYTMKKGIEQALSKQKTEKPKVLIVDDHPENILVLQKLLNKLNVDIVSATSGNEALAETLYNDFAVVFLDVQMPEMDGYEVADLLKSEDKTANIPIIFITAIDRDDAKEIKGYDKGAVDFIFKPFNEFILLSKARVFLEIYKMRAGLEELVAESTSALQQSNRQLREEIEQKEIAEKELIQTRSYLSSVVNSISSMLIGADIEGVITDMNMEAERVSGIQVIDAQGKSIDQVFPFFSHITSTLLKKADQSQPIEKNNIDITVNDVTRLYNFAVYPLIGDTRQVVIRVDDVTETKQMEMELQQHRHIDSLGQLAGGIAHDFNNMLSAIMGAAELLRIKAGNSPDFTKPIESILIAVERAADLTGKLLSFARKKGSDKTSIDMHRLIKDTVTILQRSIDKRIQIVVKSNAAKSIVEGDDSELSNALLNLGINARDAMPDGGVLTISTDNLIIRDIKEADALELQAGLYLELQVTDTGTGMSDIVKKKVFEPFFTTKDPGKGTGLGLASVYGTVKAHSGSIQLESTLGKGSSFTVLLPVSEIATEESSKSILQCPEKDVKGTVLLVDDEDIVRTIGSNLLKELGLNVITAENGRQAIEIIKEQKEEISLILLDMIMPDISGYDCYHEIKNIMPDARVIICSGYAKGEVVKELQADGVRGFIQKPYRLSALKNIIQSCLAKG